MAGLSLSSAGVAAAVLWATMRPDAYVVTPPDSTPPAADTADAAGAARALSLLQQAVRRHDGAAAARAAAPGTEAATLLPAVARNASLLDVGDFTLRYVDESSPVDDDGGWSAEVAMTWRFAGHDAAPARTETSIAFRSVDGGVRIADIGGAGAAGRTPVWLTGPVRVAASPRTLVVVAGGAPRPYARQARRAVRVIGRVLDDWAGDLVVEVPADEQDLDAALDAEPGTYTSIAAVTTAVDGRSADAPIHVFLNPAVYDRLEEQGAQVVMSHEAVHVATRAPSSGMPLWLLEGFADYVALRDVDLPFAVTAGQVIDDVRRDGLPTRLPADRAFDTGDAALGAAYEAAWLACLALERRGGEDAVVELYADVDAGASVTRALREGFGWTRRDLVEAWRARLAGLTGRS